MLLELAETRGGWDFSWLELFTALAVVGFLLAVLWLAAAVRAWRLARAALPTLDPAKAPWAVRALRLVRRVVILVVGGTLLLIGLAMVLLPGPATLVIPIGLSILAVEFVWARRLLRRLTKQVNRWLPKSDDKGTRPRDN
jgi:tellurite resistance protein TerC